MKEIIDLTVKLIEFKTMQSRPDEIGRCISFIEEYLRDLGIDYERLESNSTPSILVTPAKRRAKILLMSHIDVVDAGDHQFRPYIEEGCLYGRGSVDDKYAAALSLVLLKRHILDLRERGLGQEDLPFGIIITGDEETGGYNGADFVLGKVRADFCIALDGGNINKVVVREKGVLKLELTAGGKSAHGSRPWLGVNAIDILIDDLVKIRSLFRHDYQEDRWHKTLNTGIISGGRSHNQVPDLARAVLDIRYTENDDIEKLIQEIDDSVLSDVHVLAREPIFIGGRSHFMKNLMEISPELETTAEHGASDARFLDKYGIDGVVWGADGENSQHCENEHVVIETVYRLYDLIDGFIKKAAACS